LEPVLRAILVKDPAERADAARVEELLRQVPGRAKGVRPAAPRAPVAPRVLPLVASRRRAAAATAALGATVIATRPLHAAAEPRRHAQPVPQPASDSPTAVLRSEPSSARPRTEITRTERNAARETTARETAPKRTAAPATRATRAAQNQG